MNADDFFRKVLRRGQWFYRRQYASIAGAWTKNIIRTGNRRPIQDLNEWQSAFCEWQAERLGQPESEIRDRFLHSSNSVRGGHGGGDYRRFGQLTYEIYAPFASDDAANLLDAYEFHRHMHILRMLSYPVPQRPDDHPIHLAIGGLNEVRIIDFGCGLAQNSISLARWALSQNKRVHLGLADVSRLQLEFLQWFCARIGIPAEIFRCTAAEPFPDFAPADVLFAEELLEHVHDPVFYVETLDRLIAPGGCISANVWNHDKEFMHVSPDLSLARARLLELGYSELASHRVFRKSADSPVNPARAVAATPAMT